MMGIFIRQAFNSSAALYFNAMASGLMDNELACDRVVTNVMLVITVLCVKQNQQDIATHES